MSGAVRIVEPPVGSEVDDGTGHSFHRHVDGWWRCSCPASEERFTWSEVLCDTEGLPRSIIVRGI